MSKYKKEKNKLYKVIENAEKELDRIIKKEKEEEICDVKIGNYYSYSDGISHTTSLKILKLEPVVLAFSITNGDFISIESESLIKKSTLKILKPITVEKFSKDFTNALTSINIEYKKL